MRVVLMLLGLMWSVRWPQIEARTERSVVLVSSEHQHCAGFVINSAEHLVLTAGHCGDEEPQVNRLRVELVVWDEANDLLVLKVPALPPFPALKLAKGGRKAEDVVALGFGHDPTQIMCRRGSVSSYRTSFPDEDLRGPFVVIDASWLTGMSGGPVVNAKGEVITVVLRTSDHEGLGAETSVIRASTGKYWEHK